MIKHVPLPLLDSVIIQQESFFLLFESSLVDEENYKSYIFTNPVDIIRIDDINDVPAAYDQIDDYAQEHYIAGFFTYESGYIFEKSIFLNSDGLTPSADKSTIRAPYVYLGVFNTVIEFDHHTGNWSSPEAKKFELSTKGNSSRSNSTYTIENLKPNVDKHEYKKAIEKILHYIGEGDTYQVNYTFKYNFSFSGCQYTLYEELKSTQNVSYSSFLHFGDLSVLSLSPELFFRRDGDSIIAKPMKGTIKRGKSIQEDVEKVHNLENSVKDYAENTMIVDLIRNDVGRIAQWNSVKVPKLHTIEKFQTLFQMTSTVTAQLPDNISYHQIFESLFPCGSITGAPKIRTMQIIQELEKESRTIYCGTIGIIFPDKKAVFNVPIRTIVIQDDKGEMGIGSGIVAESKPDNELNECHVKSRFLTRRFQAFKLLETLLWDNGYFFLDEHLNRIEESAKYFDYYISRKNIQKQLRRLENSFKTGKRYKVRVLLDRAGKVHREYDVLKTVPERPSNTAMNKITISEIRTNRDDIFLYHKTDNRSLYNEEYRHYSGQGFCEVVFMNEQGEITEGAVTNVFVLKDGIYRTPPVTSGLLPGIYRTHFMNTNEVTEEVLYEHDLFETDGLFICNSVRGMHEVTLP